MKVVCRTKVSVSKIADGAAGVMSRLGVGPGITLLFWTHRDCHNSVAVVTLGYLINA